MLTHQFKLYTDDGEDTVSLPAHYEVCDRCDGTGTHTHSDINPTSEDYERDPDFIEEYFAGRYDVQCEVCHGRNVVLTVDDEDSLNDEQKAILMKLEEQWADEDASRQESAMERRMGA